MAEEPEIGGREPIAVNVMAGESYWCCRCGRSKGQPFCDGRWNGRRRVTADAVLYLQAHEVAAFCECSHESL
jgi:hypothetical protein